MAPSDMVCVSGLLFSISFVINASSSSLSSTLDFSDVFFLIVIFLPIFFWEIFMWKMTQNDNLEFLFLSRAIFSCFFKPIKIDLILAFPKKYSFY